ncbi:MAG: hypothetical protein K2K91_02700 [Ruminococcus sp.]|nr:hypothetical protein [Ruminococcus sp.]
MCRAMEERLNENSTMKAIQIAMNFLKLGTVSHEDIAKATGISIEDVKELANQINPT